VKMKRPNCPCEGSRTTTGTTAAPWSSKPHETATYQQSPTTGTRSTQAHTSVTAIDSEEPPKLVHETNGADHVNRTPIRIGRPPTEDLQNERPRTFHVITTNGPNFYCGDELRFPQECFF
jgi:hypothetical protein